MPNRKRPGPYRDDAYSNANIIAELQRAARRVVGDFTHAQFRRAGGRVDPATVRAHFGSWKEALRRAGLRHRLRPRAVGAKHSWEECYANMERMWRRLGRAPAAGDMDRDPSHVSSGTYKMRFGLWRNALVAFEAYRAGDKSAWPMPGTERGKPQRAGAHGDAAAVRYETQRRAEFGPDRIVIAIRHRVLTRENFRCAWCADSPAKNSRCRLYVQYLIPPMDGGPRDKTNITALCSSCSRLLELRRAALLRMRAVESGPSRVAPATAGACAGGSTKAIEKSLMQRAAPRR